MEKALENAAAAADRSRCAHGFLTLLLCGLWHRRAAR
jgi:hypothetical protein